MRSDYSKGNFPCFLRECKRNDRNSCSSEIVSNSQRYLYQARDFRFPYLGNAPILGSSSHLSTLFIALFIFLASLSGSYINYCLRIANLIEKVKWQVKANITRYSIKALKHSSVLFCLSRAGMT